MNLVLRVIAATEVMVLMPASGAAVGSYLGFHLVGVPSGAQCGLAVLPALVTGGIGGFIGLFSGLIPACVLAAGILWLAGPAKEKEERQSFCGSSFLRGEQNTDAIQVPSVNFSRYPRA